MDLPYFEFASIDRLRSKITERFLGLFHKCSKLTDFWHVAFVLLKKHDSEVFLLVSA